MDGVRADGEKEEAGAPHRGRGARGDARGAGAGPPPPGAAVARAEGGGGAARAAAEALAAAVGTLDICSPQKIRATARAEVLPGGALPTASPSAPSSPAAVPLGEAALRAVLEWAARSYTSGDERALSADAEAAARLARVALGAWRGDVDFQLCAVGLAGGVAASGARGVGAVLDAGLLPRLVHFLKGDGGHTRGAVRLQAAACGALGAVLATPTEAHKLMALAHGPLPILVQLVRAKDEDVCHAAVCALGVVAHHSPEFRDLVCGLDALAPLLELLADAGASHKARSAATCAVYFICSHRPRLVQDALEPVLASLEADLDSDDDSAFIHVSAILCLCGLQDRASSVCGFFPRLAKLLEHCQDAQVQLTACSVAREVATSPGQIQQLVDAGVIKALMGLLQRRPLPHNDMLARASKTLLKATVGGTSLQVRHLVQQGIAEVLCKNLLPGHMNRANKSVAKLMLNAALKILQAGEQLNGAPNHHKRRLDMAGFSSYLFSFEHGAFPAEVTALAREIREAYWE